MQAMSSTVSHRGTHDLVADAAVSVPGPAHRVVTCLSRTDRQEIGPAGQNMIDGVANFTGGSAVKAHCNECTTSISTRIGDRWPEVVTGPDMSLLSVQLQSGRPKPFMGAQLNRSTSGCQNEPRDAIAGTAWALPTHPDQPGSIPEGRASRQSACEEFARRDSPIGVAPRRAAREDTVERVDFEPESRVSFVFGPGSRDEDTDEGPRLNEFTRDTTHSLARSAGPQFRAAVTASGTLAAEAARALLFKHVPGLRISGDGEVSGWAFHGPVNVPDAWSVDSNR